MQSMPDGAEQPAELSCAHAAVWLGSVFLACLLGIVVFTVADSGVATKREMFTETTAAGDANYFRPVAESEPIFESSGRRYTVLSREKVKINDTDMVRMGRDDAGGFTLYSRRSEPGKELFVKIDVGEFLPLRPR
jgi:hypothetical protein